MDEAERAFPVIRREATRSASHEEIARVLAARFAIYPQPKRTDGEWASWWADYTNALDDLPPSAIEAGMAAYIKGPDSEFFPKPGRIRDLAKTTPNPLASACEGIRRNLERQFHRDRLQDGIAQLDSGRGVERELATKEQVQAMMAEFNKAMAEKAPAPKPVRPPVSGPVDGSGITQLMRQRMERDGGC